MSRPSLPLSHLLAAFREIARRYRGVWRNKDYRINLAIAVAALLVAWTVNYLSIQFATEHTSNSVTDIVLSNIPVFEVDGLFVYGTFVFAFFSVVVILAHPKRIPFALKAAALFWIIRSIMILPLFFSTAETKDGRRKIKRNDSFFIMSLKYIHESTHGKNRST